MRVWVLEVPVDEARDRQRHTQTQSRTQGKRDLCGLLLLLLLHFGRHTKVNSIYYACIRNSKVEVDLS